MGSGPARNKGIDAATGDYIMFVDPDDWIDKDMILRYVEIMNETPCDIVVSGIATEHYASGGKHLSTDKDILDEIYHTSLDATRAEYLSLFNKGLIRGPTSKLYRRNIINKHGLRFPSFRRSQDIVFNYEYYKCIKSVRVFNSAFYHYRCIAGKQRKKIPNDYYKTISKIYNDVVSMYKEWNIRPKEDMVYKFCSYEFNSLCYQLLHTNSGKIINDIIKDEGICCIAKNARYSDLKREIVRNMVIKKKPRLLRLYLFFAKCYISIRDHLLMIMRSI